MDAETIAKGLSKADRPLAEARRYFNQQSREISALKSRGNRLAGIVRALKEGPPSPLPDLMREWVSQMQRGASDALKAGEPSPDRSPLLMRSIFASKDDDMRGLPWGRLPVPVTLDCPDGTSRDLKLPATSQYQVTVARHPDGPAFGVLALVENGSAGQYGCHRSFSQSELDDLIAALETLKSEVANHNGALLDLPIWGR